MHSKIKIEQKQVKIADILALIIPWVILLVKKKLK